MLLIEIKRKYFEFYKYFNICIIINNIFYLKLIINIYATLIKAQAVVQF
jgi:hypothetical protein